jgi:hypothetical protein
MNRLKQKFGSFGFPTQSVPLLLLLVGILSYGLLFQKLGYFWDEWPITWIANRLGSSGLARYFETNRPFWGQIYRLTTTLFGYQPWVWQVFGLFWHWLTACGLWLTLRQTWPKREQVAVWASLLFLVYPGFRQSPIAMMYGHFFIAYAALFGSFALSLWALRKPKYHQVLTLVALLLSLINLLSLEYFFLLDFLRPLLFWFASDKQVSTKWEKIRNIFKAWLPYFLLVVAVIFWRTVIFSYQTHNYQPTLLAKFSADPFAAILSLAGTVLKDLGTVTFSAWNDIFKLPSLVFLGSRSFLVAVAAILVGLLGMIIYFLKFKSTESQEKNSLFQMMGLGFLAALVAGLPFWLTDLPVGLGFPNDRFTLPFIFGVSLFIASLVFLIPGGKLVHISILALLTSLSIGWQFQNGVAYQRDWNIQRNLFWQMSWRIPALQPGTAMVTSNLPLKYFSDNSLAAPLNWVYSAKTIDGRMDYMFYDASVRSTRALKLVKNQPILQGYLAADFEGNTNQLVVFDFRPPACFRVLDAAVDPLNPGLSTIMREASAFSNPASIQLEGKPAVPEFAIFGTEPEHGWCYYFEKGDLARQRGDWTEAAHLGDIAFSSGDYPNDPAERMLFIEAYAHTGNWPRALELTDETASISGLLKPSLSILWQRIEGETPASLQRSEVLQKLTELLSAEQ